MMRFPMSAAGAGVLRALLCRAGVSREQVRLTDYRATDWRSLTFNGERHELALSIPGSDGSMIASRLVDGLEDHEFTILGQIVADIGATSRSTGSMDGSVEVRIEALTIAA